MSLSKSIKSYFKKRNWTRKSLGSFRKQLFHHLTPKEYAALPFPNDLDTFHKHAIDTGKRVTLPLSAQRISREIQKEHTSVSFNYSGLLEEHDRESGYVVLKETRCKPQILLDFKKWAKKFPYFHVGANRLNPAGDTWLLAIDFVGSDTYHLFTKSLYAEDYHHIKIPSQERVSMSQWFSQERTATNIVIWLDNVHILYVAVNRYYNESGVYLYNLESKQHMLLYTNEPGCFIWLEKVTSGLFILIYSRNYHSDAVYVMDVETLKIRLLLPRKFSVKYPYLNHERGEWIVCKRDKHKDLLASTSDFRKWTIHYQNKNPYEQILKVFYQKEWFVFLLETLSGLCLYSLKCKRLVLLDKSFDGYELSHLDKDAIVVYRHKYTCPKEPIRISLEHQTAILPKMKPRYHEEEIFIHSHLRVTLLYKTKKSFSPCLLRGYGGYNDYKEVCESVFYYPLLERGFVIAIAHLRGDGEYGYKGYDQGRMLHKKNTFQDFIDTAHFLIDQKWTSRDQLAIWGRSFGGLLMSAVLNQEPDLCKVALVGVPFVLPLETMGNENLPLGLATQSELGNLRDKKIQKYIHSYAPLEHIQPDGRYPHMLIYTNLQDTSIPYKEPQLYYEALQKVEVYRTGQSNLTLYTDPRFGHTQGSLNQDKCDHYGLLFSYVLKYLKYLNS